MTVILYGSFKQYLQEKTCLKNNCLLFYCALAFNILICNKQLLINIVYYCYKSSIIEAIKAQELFSALTKANSIFTLNSITGVL